MERYTFKTDVKGRPPVRVRIGKRRYSELVRGLADIWDELGPKYRVGWILVKIQILAAKGPYEPCCPLAPLSEQPPATQRLIKSVIYDASVLAHTFYE